ncbi:MAG: hypothetical protein CM1200mP27_00600 [Chloroflexota bacterium]|nr:MAG: hypothetical protein CM1200mP27_00600 [Chloroflexota bacterium]
MMTKPKTNRSSDKVRLQPNSSAIGETNTANVVVDGPSEQMWSCQRQTLRPSHNKRNRAQRFLAIKREMSFIT